AIIETPKGSSTKFNYDPETNLFCLEARLPEGMMFPYDFGFIPSTLGEDGDPLDILVLLDTPTHVGCLMQVRIVGVICVVQTVDGRVESNDRLLGVATHSSGYEELRSISDVSKSALSQIQEFFLNYARLRGKKVRITGIAGPRKGDPTLEARHARLR